MKCSSKLLSTLALPINPLSVQERNSLTISQTIYLRTLIGILLSQNISNLLKSLKKPLPHLKKRSKFQCINLKIDPKSKGLCELISLNDNTLKHSRAPKQVDPTHLTRKASCTAWLTRLDQSTWPS